ncbi:hypothetical protein KAM334_04390 [Aeromonas caviae]|nr:hypothetical protein KAM334_04390 [Aeromonas caviae]
MLPFLHLKQETYLMPGAAPLASTAAQKGPPDGAPRHSTLATLGREREAASPPSSARPMMRLPR